MSSERLIHMPQRPDPSRDMTTWDQKTPEQKAACLIDHLMLEHLSGNLRPKSAEGKGRQPRPGSYGQR